MLGIFLVGFFLEVTADEQMRSFKNKNPNRSVTYTGGVWRFIKSPNYLGEILVWLSFGLLALPFQYGILGLISPITMIYFLTFVSGIPYLEQDRNKKEAFPNPRPLYKYLPFLY